MRVNARGLRRVGVLGLLPLVVASAASGSTEWVVDDLVKGQEIDGWAVAPDGASAVWVLSTVAKVDGEEKRVSNLWMRRLSGGEAFPLTRGNDRVRSPRFSPDGERIAFLSNRSPPTAGSDERADRQLWILELGRGEPFPATAFERDVQTFGWMGERRLAVLAADARSAWEREREETKDTAVVVDDAEHEPPVRLFVVDIDGGIRRLSTNQDWIESLAVSPDGRWAVIGAGRSLSYDFDQRIPPETRLVDLETGSERTLFAGSTLLPRTVRWDLDGSGFYFLNDRTRHPVYRMATVSDLHRYELATGRVERLDDAWDRGVGGGYTPVTGGVLALLADGVRLRPARYARSDEGWQRHDVAAASVPIQGWRASGDGRFVVYEVSSLTAPPQLHAARLDGDGLRDERQLTDLNPGLAEKPMGRFEVLRWSGAGGDTVEGILQYPLDWKSGQRRPLVLDIHGGPTGVDQDRWDLDWHDPNQLWRQRGAFVLQVNYHGSSGYGLDWVESIEGRYYELEIPDIEAGVDHVIELGLVDPARLAVTGWSNGGILAAELITRTERYRAAVIGAADVEWISDWANVDFGASFDNYYFGGPPWEIPQVYLEKSPFFRLTEVTTPALIHTGTEDRNVPPHQSWSLFRALQQLGKTEARLVLYPGEPHGLRKVAHQRRKIEEDVAWLDRHLFGLEQSVVEALPQGSPLHGLLQRRRAARVGERLGVEVAGALIPETARWLGIELGRFEVTRAQYAEFEGAADPVPAESANLPVTGVEFDEARRYAAWLAERTGLPFRLPTEAEARRFAEAAGTAGNTLDRWAGYRPGPEDAASLLQAVGALPGSAPLLLPVGSLPGEGDPAIFDLDGNAAEWATNEEGEGVAVGPSAERSTDPYGGPAPRAEYTGLRVLVDGG